MFYHELFQSGLQELTGRMKFPAISNAKQKHIKFRYPNVKKTRKYNDSKREEARVELTKKLYFRYVDRISKMSDTRKAELKQKINNLHPSLSALKAFYKAKGETDEIIDKLITKENYLSLPNVWITRKQKNFLLAVIDGYSHNYQTFINNGFK